MKISSLRFLMLPIAIFLFIGFTNGQGYEVKVRFKNLKDTLCYLGFDFGNNKYIHDTARIDHKGNAVFKDTRPLEGGVYIIITPDKRMFEFILVEHYVSFIADTSDFIGKMEVVKSNENKLFFNYLRFMQLRHTERMTLRQAMGKYKKNTDSFNLFYSKIQKVDSMVLLYKEDLRKKNPNTFLVKMLHSMDEPRERDKLPDEADSTYSKYLYGFYQEHFFDNIDFKDARILKTPVYEAKVDKFLNELTFRNPDSVCKSSERLIDKSRANDTFFRFTLPKVFNKYVPAKYMGDDAIFICLAEKYYLSGLAYWVDSVTLNKIYTEYLKKVKNQVGMKAPNLILKDTSDHFVSLYDINKTYTILVFWDPTCSHCKAMIPKLVEWYNQHSKDSFAIFSVTNATDKASWVSFIKEHHMNWINTWDPENSTDYRMLYDAGSFPVIYIIDKAKIIQARRIDIEQLDSMIRILNKG